MYRLSEEQLNYYEQNGFIVIKNLIELEALYDYKKRFTEICKGLHNPGNTRIVKEVALIEKGAKGEDLINKLQDFLYDDVLCQYAEHPRLVGVVSQFIGDGIRAMHSMLINKPPGSEEHPPHQDLYYFPFRPTEKIIASWTAIDDVHLHNGCLYVVPGSHKLNTLYPHGNVAASGKKKLYHGILEESAAPVDKRVPLVMSPGDTVLFHPLLVHGSGPNLTKSHRKSISVHFANSTCHYVDLRGSVQENIMREVEAEALKHGVQISYEDIWRYKSKMVRGVKSNL